ncbi:MAG: PorP/SprF family type IX secretion system membrane protein [Sphingobacteriales bacterium]|nr:PorP/SprF family type IX secretion system membrane protein [Sphingobacteriales bacterium]
MRKYVRSLIATVAIALSGATVFAQDIHFSQFYASPLTLNPALTGLMDGCYRGAANYRNQYSDLAPYSTVSASYDMVLLRGQIGNTADHLGVGAMFYNDRAGYGSLNTTTFMASVAYHKAFDKRANYRLSVGAQGGLMHKSLDFSKISFENQFIGTGFDPNQPNGEAVDNPSISFGDFRAGMIFSGAPMDNFGFYIGGAMFHLTKPNESFLGDTDNKLDSRLVVHGGANFLPTDNFSISPNFIYMAQAGAKELNIGALLGYRFDGNSRDRSSGSAVYLGGSYRVKDAFIILAGLEYNSFRFGLSYDINISDLKVATLGQGGIELSLIYEAMCEPRGRRGFPPMSCPRF